MGHEVVGLGGGLGGTGNRDGGDDLSGGRLGQQQGYGKQTKFLHKQSSFWTFNPGLEPG